MLPKLTVVDCYGCEKLTSPPYVVWTQGIKAVRKYFFDLAAGADQNVKYIPVTVIGQTMAGKTSLVKSMRDNTRVLTFRSETNLRDEATKVFKVCEASVDDQSRLVFHDFGGQAIYHSSYQLSMRSQFVPMLVIDIAEFHRLSSLSDPETACRELCFEWLSHLFLACPQAGPPLVILTHRDGISDDSVFELSQKQLIDTTEALQQETVAEEEALAPQTSTFFSMKSFCDLSSPLLTLDRIKVFSRASDISDINELKRVLLTMGLALLTEIPASWYLMMNLCLGQKDEPFLTLDQLSKLFPDDKDHIILQYLTDIGIVMWYKHREKLASIVFHRSEVLTKIVELVFDHSSEEAWKQRVAVFKPFSAKGKGVTKRRYEDMVQHFQSAGLMDEVLLSRLLEEESELSSELAIEILKTFHLICGPIKGGRNSYYSIPYFCKKSILLLVTGSLIPLKIDICFNGLSIPNYVYHLLTAVFVDFQIEPEQIDVGMNGASVLKRNGTILYLLHNSYDRVVTILAMSSIEQIVDAWESQMSTLHHLTSQLRSLWRGAHYDVLTYCAHCLMTKQSVPKAQLDPDWLEELTSPQYTGEQIAPCERSSFHSRPLVPSPLQRPCKWRQSSIQSFFCYREVLLIINIVSDTHCYSITI